MADTTPETKPETPNEAPGEKIIELTEDALAKMIKSEADRVATHHFQEKKKLEAELESLRKKQMSEDELKKYERKQLEERLTQKERELNDKEVGIKARDLLTEMNLPLTFVNFIKADSIEETETRAKSLAAEWQKAVAVATDEKFKAGGRDPAKGRDGSAPTGFSGMTAKEIQDKARRDPDWFKKNEKEILDMMNKGQIKR